MSGEMYYIKNGRGRSRKSTKLKRKSKQLYQKLRITLKRENEEKWKKTIKIKSEDEEIFLGFHNDGVAVVLKDCS